MGTPNIRYQWLVDHKDYDQDTCLEWPFCKNRDGYGRVTVGRKKDRNANRVMCQLVHGNPPPGKHVAAHSCGNPGCVNPLHLRWATHKENTSDMLTHGTMLYGSDRSGAKLTEQDVHAIRRAINSGNGDKAIASGFGVHRRTIRDVRLGRSWSWLKTPSIKKPASSD